MRSRIDLLLNPEAMPLSFLSLDRSNPAAALNLEFFREEDSQVSESVIDSYSIAVGTLRERELVERYSYTFAIDDRGLCRTQSRQITTNHILMFCHSSAMAKRLICLTLVVAIIHI
jgi:hypothetical protein